MFYRNRLIVSVAFISIFSTVSAFAEQCDNPDKLVFSIIPTEETTQEVNLYQPVLDELQKNTGKEVEFFMPTSYSSVIEAMMNGWVHIGVHGPNSYVIAKEKDPKLEVFATYAKLPGHFQEEGPGYKAVLISRSDSNLKSIEAIKGKVAALADPASTSGNLLPRVEFQEQIAIAFDEYFSRVVYSGGHDLSALAVKEGRADVAFVATHRLDNVIDRGLAKKEDFNVIWESQVIPQDPFVYQGNLCPDLKQAIKKSFLTLNEVPEAKAFLDNVNSARFVEMQDSDYDIIRRLAAAQKQ